MGTGTELRDQHGLGRYITERILPLKPPVDPVPFRGKGYTGRRFFANTPGLCCDEPVKPLDLEKLLEREPSSKNLLPCRRLDQSGTNPGQGKARSTTPSLPPGQGHPSLPAREEFPSSTGRRHPAVTRLAGTGSLKAYLSMTIICYVRRQRGRLLYSIESPPVTDHQIAGESK